MGVSLYLSRTGVVDNQFRVDLAAAGGGSSEVMEIPVGAYYNDSSTASESLRAAIDTAFDAHTVLPDFTITFSTSTGKFTISTAATTFELHWNTGVYGTAFRDWLGFTGDKTGATSYTSDNPAQGCIATSSGRSNYSGKMREYSGATVVSESGVVARVGTSNARILVRYDHSFERLDYQASAWESGCFDDAGTTVPWTFQDWADHHARTGQPWRYYLTMGAAIGSYFGEFSTHESTVNDFKPDMVIPNSTLYWKVPIFGRQWVTP